MSGEFNTSFENSASISLDIEREYEYLDEDWEIREGYIIPQRGYPTPTID